MGKYPFSSFLVGTLTSTYLVLQLAASLAHRSDVAASASSPRVAAFLEQQRQMQAHPQGTKDYEMELKSRMNMTVTRKELAEVARVRDTYNSYLRDFKESLDGLFEKLK